MVSREDQTTHTISLSQCLTQSKSLTLFNSVKAERGEKAAEEKFDNRSWLMRVKERSRNIKLQGEATSADIETAANYPKDPAKIINENGYTKLTDIQYRTFNIYWKKMPSRAFRAREEKSMPDFKGQADSLVRS